MSHTKHNRPRKPKNLGKGELKRASGSFRKATQKHIPQQPGGYARYSQRYLNNTARKAVRVQERIDLKKLKIDPEFISEAENRALIHWTLLDYYW